MDRPGSGERGRDAIRTGIQTTWEGLFVVDSCARKTTTEAPIRFEFAARGMAY